MAALGFTSLTVGAAVALGRGSGDGPVPGLPGPEVIVGFGLSGAAAATYGALAAAITQVVNVSGDANPLSTLFCAVAIGGVVRGNTLVGPIAAAIGAFAAQLLIAAGLLRNWEPGGRQLSVACLLAACLLVSHTLDRALGTRPGTTHDAGPAPPPTPLGAAAGGEPPPSPWPPPPDQPPFRG